MATHFLPARPEHLHTRWDRSLPPVLSVYPGDVVVLETVEGMGGQIDPATVAVQLDGLDRTRLHTLTGPVAVRGARPGDVLAITVLEIRPSEHGINYHRPGVGLLPDLFPDSHLLHFRLDEDRRWAEAIAWSTGETQHPLAFPLHLPVRPFMGIYGVAPAEPGAHRTIPPGAHGGNLDCKELGPGATLYLPVQVEGALFSTGDGHASQGDGEVNVTGLEIAMERVVLQFDLRRDLDLTMPRAETPTHHITFGIDPDLDLAARQAVTEMVDHLGALYGLERNLAYALCSLSVDLHITQAVNGIRGVHALFPKAVLKEGFDGAAR